MSGRIKVLEGGAKVQEADEPPLPADYYKVPSAYDASCGGYDLEAYRDSGGRCAHETFLCTDDAFAVFQEHAARFDAYVLAHGDFAPRDGALSNADALRAARDWLRRAALRGRATGAC